jgi:hypothetical protein
LGEIRLLQFARHVGFLVRTRLSGGGVLPLACHRSWESVLHLLCGRPLPDGEELTAPTLRLGAGV